MINLISRLVPKPLAKLLYWPIFIMAKSIFSKSELLVWPRNSYYFGNLAFLKSDIDLTFFASKRFNNRDIFENLESHKLFKCFIPIIGEVNFYRSEDIDKIGKLLNPLEVQRDPLLKKLKGIEELTPNDFDRYAFLTHMILADSHNLTRSLISRKRKWSFHLEQLGKGDFEQIFQSNNLESFLNYLAKNCFNDFDPSNDFSLLKKLMPVNRERHQEVNAFYKSLTPDQLKSFILISPALWVGCSLWADKWDEENAILREMSLEKQKIYLSQLNWEIWGVLSQFHQSEKLSLIIGHLNSLKISLDSLNKLPRHEVDSTKKAMNLVIQRVREWIQFTY